MCGIAGMFGEDWRAVQLRAMVEAQRHRGPDDEGIWADPQGNAGLGHNRLSIIDLSAAGHQPMESGNGRFQIVYNGEIYNYLELRRELSGYPFRGGSDTEVILAAYERWGEACLERLLGMFAFLIWDRREQELFAARDRFGVKPLYYHETASGGLWVASEIKALHAAGVAAEADEGAWANYLVHGLHDNGPGTFWRGVKALPGGCRLRWREGRQEIARWYELEEDALDQRPVGEVKEEYRALLEESVRLRFRSDVAVGINLSGGLDSSVLLGLVEQMEGPERRVRAFTFVTGDPRYDELPWVQRMLSHTQHPSVVCRLRAEEVPSLAADVQRFQDEPFGGVPTLAYAKVFAAAREQGVTVLLDGQGMDEQWAGYDYYAAAPDAPAAIVQGSEDKPLRPECVTPELREKAPGAGGERWRWDRLRSLQHRDLFQTKIPRALRYNDRISMRSSTELREPFLDHRLVELAFRQPSERKIQGGVRKWLLRQIAAELLPNGVEAPKRPVQTPQREWLRGPLAEWAGEAIEAAIGSGWLDGAAARKAWREYRAGAGDNSFYIWQWVSLGLMQHSKVTTAHV